MDDLIEALNIFKKYKSVRWPTNCRRDVFAIMEVEEAEVSAEDKKRLDELSFLFSEEYDCWISFRFGSA